MKCRTVLTMMAWIAFVGVAVAEEDKPQLKMYFHELVSISTTNVVLEPKDKPMVFVTTTNTVYLARDGKKLSPKDFKPKDSLRVTFYENKGVSIATEILKHAGYFTVSPSSGGLNLNP